MGTCLMCHRKIRNGQKFCDSCKQKRKNRADESYLDSLLTSVGVKVTPSNTDPDETYPIEDTQYQDETIYRNEDSYQDGSSFQNETVTPYQDGSSYQNENPYQDISSYQDEIPNQNETAYQDEVPYQNGNVPVEEQTAFQQPDDYGGMDDIISDILEDMPENDVEENPSSDGRDSGLLEDDIENIFDEAEAYANLLNNQKTQALDNQPLPNDQEITEVLDNSDMFISSDIDSFFTDINAAPSDTEVSGEDGKTLSLDDAGLNAVDESLQGENTDRISVSQAFDDFDPVEESIPVPQKKKKKKLSWFKRLFGNTNDEVTPEMLEADRLQKEEKKKAEDKIKEEKKKKAEAAKAAQEADKARKKAEADAERNRKIALAAEKKALAKEKARKKQETALAIAEYEMEHGKINKAGATILFVIFAILTIVIIIGTNIYSYNLSLQNAREDFEVKKYNEAYDDIYGYGDRIKADGVEQDIKLYDKIMTVMYVNTQLNSYEYYMKSGNREKALDSLLKGLQRYDKYLEFAREELGIEDDMNYVKGEILETLDSEFGLNEEQAYSMITIDDSVDYSEYLYKLLGSYQDELEKYK